MGRPKDEPVSQRWGKVESELWRRRHSHSPTAPRCLRTARYGRTMRDLRRTGGVSGGTPSKRTYKRERNGEQRSASSRTASQYLKHSRKLCNRAIGGCSGPEKGAGEGSWKE